jgi:hypothetical protein
LLAHGRRLSQGTLFLQLLYGKCNIYSVLNKKKFEGTKGVIIIRNAKKERQRSGQKKKDKQLLAHGRRLSQGTPDSSTTKTGRHDFAEILLKVTLNTTNHPKSTD